MTAYRVVRPYQVHVDGVTYGPGETVETTDGVAAPMVTAGWLEPARKTPAKPAARQAK